MDRMARTLCVAVALGPITSAGAGEPSAPAPPAGMREVVWSGFYAGGQLGWARGNDITREFLTQPWTYVNLQNRFEPDGFFGGIHVGANVQSGGFVAGVEADVEIGDISGGFIDPPEPPFNPGGRGRTEIGIQGSLRGRLGYAVGQALPYVTGGVAAAELQSTYWNWGGISESFSKTVIGYTVGGGLEYAISPALSIRGEYRFTEYELTKNHSRVAFPGFTGTQEPSYHSGRIGASFRF